MSTTGATSAICPPSHAGLQLAAPPRKRQRLPRLPSSSPPRPACSSGPGTFRFHDDRGAGLGGFCMLGTFAERAVVSQNSCVRVDEDIPLEVAALAGCGVPTGWGTSVYAAGVAAGDTVVIFGAGGVGTNAVQGAKYAGARHIVVIDPVEFKRENR